METALDKLDPCPPRQWEFGHVWIDGGHRKHVNDLTIEIHPCMICRQCGTVWWPWNSEHSKGVCLYGIERLLQPRTMR
jgi:hypothetical protein